MKKCLQCKFLFEKDEWLCPNCSWHVDSIDTIPSFAPEFALSGGGFNPEAFSKLRQVEEASFWFNNRNNLIIWALNTFFRDIEKFFEIGCGTGFVLKGIHQARADLQLFGCEIFVQGLKFAKERAQNAVLLQMDARAIPFENEFDVIGSFDVLEHIEEDELVLQQMYQAVKPGGGIIITVPQHQFLWSSVDEEAHHVRRYSAQELQKKVKKVGFTLVHTTSFVTLLFPVMLLSRWKNTKKESHESKCELGLPPHFNEILSVVMKIESFFIKHKISAPYGGSLLLIAHKK